MRCGMYESVEINVELKLGEIYGDIDRSRWVSTILQRLVNSRIVVPAIG